MLLIYRVENTYLMLKRDHGDKRFMFIFYKPKNKKKKSQTDISELVKAIGNVMAADASAVNVELESFSKEKGRKVSSYNTFIRSRVKEEVGKYAYSNGTQATINRFKSKYPQYPLFYIHLSTIGNVSSITRKKICYHQSSINVRDLIP